MEKYVVRYLLITGVLGTIAVKAPALVVLGLFLMVIPGLVLGIMPTAFLWGAIFAVIWWPLKFAMGERFAAVVALAGAAAALTVIPQTANRQIEADVAALRAEDRDARHIELKGVVRYERTSTRFLQDDPDWKARLAEFHERKERIDWSQRALACDALCVATLFTPGVDAVIIVPIARAESIEKPPPNPGNEFRLEHRPGCVGSLPPVEQASYYDGFTAEPALMNEWRARIATGNCIRRTAIESKPDVTITIADWSSTGGANRPSSTLTRPLMSMLRLEVRDAVGKRLLRRTRVHTALLDPVLWIEGIGSVENFSFDWARFSPPQGQEPGAFTPAELLASVAGLRVTPDPEIIADAGRTQLTLALGDPARGPDDPAFGLTDPVFRDIGDKGLRDGDAALVERIVSDPRTGNFNGIWEALKKMGQDAERVRAPIVSRILAARYPEDADTGARQLGNVLRILPPGIFATPTSEELALLNDPDRRNWAEGLIIRQADRGAAAVPLVTRILVEAWQRKSATGSRTLDAVGPVRQALCIIGPDAHEALSAIDGLVEAGDMPPTALESREWQLTLARLGRPIESFKSPSNHSWSDAQLQRWLRRRLERFDVKRDCDY